MGSIGPYQLLMIDKFIMHNNIVNESVKFFPRVEEATLISISVRFFPPDEKYFTEEVEEKIFDEIKTLSHRRMFMEKNGLLRYGIMELRVSYVHQYCKVEDLINAMDFIANKMTEIIKS